MISQDMNGEQGSSNDVATRQFSEMVRLMRDTWRLTHVGSLCSTF